jgi:hypothetical protein
MNGKSPSSPRVFVSYSWESESHKEWVLRLATDLRRSGVDVVLDRWVLRPGDDLAAFMDSAVTSADFLLLVCTESYADRANGRLGSVGYEQAVIAGGLLTDGATTAKIVPALRSGTPATALPSYLRSRLFVDFRADDGYARSVEQLLRHFHGAPEHAPPPPGPPPDFARPAASEGASPHPSASPTRWVLVAGTGIERKFTSQERETATRVGRELAAGTFGLISGGWPGVDDVAARSFANELARRGLPLENFLTQVVAETQLPTFPAGNLILVKEGTAEWTEAIGRADAVVLIGGLGGTLTTGRIAAGERKPVFPLADTGRDAKAFYVEMIRDWERLGPPGIPKAHFQRVARPAPDVAADLLELLRAM